MYPLYKRSKSNGAVVMFTGISTGTVLHVGRSSYTVGYSSSIWGSHTNSSIWEDYKLSPEELPNPEKLSLFESVLVEATRYTRVPGGYVLTSHSGHQLFVKEAKKETL